jgi:hypothetical protein
VADDFLKQKLDELRSRVRELRPMHEEYLRIEAALRSLEGGSPPAPKQARRGPGRPRGSKSTRTGKKGTQRRRRGGTRAEHAARVVAENPGVAVPEIAEKLKIKPNYVYRVMANLQKEGVVRKRGKAYYPSAGAAVPSGGAKAKKK